jgi:hypothetical protein
MLRAARSALPPATTAASMRAAAMGGCLTSNTVIGIKDYCRRALTARRVMLKTVSDELARVV